MYISTHIVALKLGFESAIQYVQSRGWTLSKKGTKVSLQYCKLASIVSRFAPNNESRQVLDKHFNGCTMAENGSACIWSNQDFLHHSKLTTQQSDMYDGHRGYLSIRT
jgi:hypothetical protein